MADKAPVILVVLRQPNRRPDEKRSDPFWEFGSFGCTGCHRRNLLHAVKVDVLSGVRLAFAQGGDQGFKLVFLTPPIRLRRHPGKIEAFWSPRTMPFRYDGAPLLINNEGEA
jgi:hypothetical protein